MLPSRILPDLQASVLCEEVRQEINGNFILIGVIGFVQVPQLPVTALKLCIFNRWVAGIGTFTENVRIVAPVKTTVIRQSNVKFGLQDPSHNATNVSVFGQIKFETEGTYYVEVLVDDVMKLRFPIPIRVVPQPGEPGQQG